MRGEHRAVCEKRVSVRLVADSPCRHRLSITLAKCGHYADTVPAALREMQRFQLIQPTSVSEDI